MARQRIGDLLERLSMQKTGNRHNSGQYIDMWIVDGRKKGATYGKCDDARIHAYQQSALSLAKMIRQTFEFMQTPAIYP